MAAEHDEGIKMRTPLLSAKNTYNFELMAFRTQIMFLAHAEDGRHSNEYFNSRRVAKSLLELFLMGKLLWENETRVCFSDM
jgi:hypothetical protein